VNNAHLTNASIRTQARAHYAGVRQYGVVMLIIEIALGIVLAVIILGYWQELIKLGVIGIIGVAIISFVGLASYFAYINFDLIVSWLPVVTVILSLFVIPILFRASEEKLSALSLKKYKFRFGEVFGLVLSSSAFFLGIFLILSEHVGFGTEQGYKPIGVLIGAAGILGSRIYLKEILETKKLQSEKKLSKE
jgi:hypothetical protein